MDIVKRIASLALQWERGLLSNDEYAEYLLEAAQRKAEEVKKTYTFIALCDGIVITKQEKLSYSDLADAVRCYRCEPGPYASPHVDCPSDRLLSELNSTGQSSVVFGSEDTPCGTDVMIAYVNR